MKNKVLLPNISVEQLESKIAVAEGALSATYFASVIMYNALIDFTNIKSFDQNERFHARRILLKHRDALNYLRLESSEMDTEGITYEAARKLWETFQNLPMAKENTSISFNTHELQTLLQIEVSGSAVGASYNLVRGNIDPVKPIMESLRKYGMDYTLDKFERFYLRYNNVLNDLAILDRIVMRNLKQITGKDETVITTRLDQLSHLFIDRGYSKLNAK